VIYGWDISTSIIGVSVFNDDGEYQTSFYIDLRKTEGQLAKADVFLQWLKTTDINSINDNFHFVEERLGGFAGGRTSAQVLMKLAQFNAIVSYILWTFRPGPHRQIAYLHPSTWKATMRREGLIIPKGADKKALTLEFVRRKERRFPYEKNRNEKPQPWCFDEADAYCIGLAGWRQLEERKKAGGPQVLGR
jgi:hypothetical protein